MTNMDNHKLIGKERNGGMLGLKRTLDIPLTFSGLRLLQLLLPFSLQNWVLILRLSVNMAGRYREREVERGDVDELAEDTVNNRARGRNRN